MGAFLWSKYLDNKIEASAKRDNEKDRKQIVCDPVDDLDGYGY